MKAFFLGAALLAAILYGIAQATLTRPPDDGIIRMRWATDPNPARTTQLSRFSEMFPHLEVTVDPGLGGDQTKLIVQCATGTGPAIIDLYDHMQMASLVEAGVLLDLTPYAEQMGFGVDRTFESVRDQLMVDGRQYRFPCNIATWNLLYNKRVFDRLGVTYPSDDVDFDELIRIGKALREAAARRGERIIPLTDMNFLTLLIIFGGNFFQQDGLYSAFDSEAAVAAMQMRHDLMHEHRVIPTTVEAATVSAQGGWGGDSLTWFSGDRAAMLLIGRWYTIQLPQYPGLAERLGVTGLPRVPGLLRMSPIQTRAAGINRNSPYWREALNFLVYLASPEYSELIVADGDGIPPSPFVAQTGEDLVNRFLPDAKLQQAFLDATINARNTNLSNFIENGLVNRLMWEAQGFVDNKLKTPRKALTDLTNEIERTIDINLERRPDLQERFREVTGMEWSRDWRRKIPKERYELAGRNPDEGPPYWERAAGR